MEIRDKKSSENVVADHLSRLVNEEVTVREKEIRDEFLDESLFMMSERPWFADLANFKVAGIIPKDLTWQQRKKFLHDAYFYVWDDPYLFKIGANNILRRCVTKDIMVETKQQLRSCNQDSFGHQSLKMLTNMHCNVINVREWGESPGEMKCHCRILWKLKCLIAGVLIL